MNNLGRLERVDLRNVWQNEAGDFTPWLAEEANIALLGDTIGIDLEVEAQEKNVGPFRADILCKDTANDHWVLIENQLERTDHSHLGQLITYAAGLNAVTIVWVAQRFTEEHRAALDWLNEMTGEDITFFGLEVELWRIGNSPVAPKFNVISSPNDWTKSVSGAAGKFTAGELTDTKKLQLEYWTKLWEMLEKRGTSIRGTKPRPQNWNNFAIGRSYFGMHASVNTQDQFIQVFITCKGPHGLPHFNLLHQQKDVIESELGTELEWQDMPDRKECRIKLKKTGVDPARCEDWASQHEWISSWLERFDKTFRPIIRDLDTDDFYEDEDVAMGDDE